MSNAETNSIPPVLLAQLETAGTELALALLHEHQLATPEAAAALVAAALERAEASSRTAAHWLSIAETLDQQMGENPSLQAQIHYARARVYLQLGDLQQAELALHEAQIRWQNLEDAASLARSHLGMTQILTFQGRFDEAEQAIGQAIAHLPAGTQQLAWAYGNLANLLDRRGDYTNALSTYDRARKILMILESQASAVEKEQIAGETAEVDLNRANVLMALDRPHEAERVYLQALSHFEHDNDTFNQGRISNNLGSLYLRTGRYAEAIEAFDRAEAALVGDALVSDKVDIAQIRQADILFLDQAHAYVALNLFSEAVTALERCQTLFRTSDQPYELAQSLHLLGLLRLQAGDLAAAQHCLQEAQQIFGNLAQIPWHNRTELALANLDERSENRQSAIERLDRLLALLKLPNSEVPGDPSLIISTRDLSTAVEARLLRLQIHLDQNAHDAARHLADQIEQMLAETTPLPHLQLRLAHALGSIDLATGHFDTARNHLYQALHLLEDQRMSLPLEEFRTAYLADKFHIHSSLMVSLLHGSETTPAHIHEAFEVVERARARSLLERLRMTLPDGANAESEQGEAPQTQQIYRRLHWLYNQLLEEGPQRSLLGPEIQEYEQVLERLAWKTARPHNAQEGRRSAQVQPVSLAQFQESLTEDQQAIFYYIVEPDHRPQTAMPPGGEVLAFLVERTGAAVFRRLCTAQQLKQAQDELQFQLGRAELGQEYLDRHQLRLTAALQRALYALYRLLIEPMAGHLHSSQISIAPYGPLHMIPFHALWDGEQYLVERFTCSYTPSASVAVHCAATNGDAPSYRSWAGLALTDPAIPQAQREVKLIAHQFAQSWLYLDEDADQAGLRKAAVQADILHVATHGLFRPDNPFFSSLKLADGWIDVRAIYQLPLSARLVVLSACESGGGEIRGDEVIGLARGFLGAGAQNLLVSLWNVHDESVVDLMSEFYQQLTNGVKPANALRKAQQKAIGEGQHPYFWASFLSIGT